MDALCIITFCIFAYIMQLGMAGILLVDSDLSIKVRILFLIPGAGFIFQLMYVVWNMIRIVLDDN